MRLFPFFQKTEPFLKVLKQYFSYISVGKADSTLEKHHFYYQAIEKFFICTERGSVQLHEIKIKTMEEMRQWLHTEKQRTGEHVSRHIEHCRASFNYAIMMEFIKYNPISQIKNVREKLSDPISLTVVDIVKLQQAKFTSKNRQLVVDLFLFQCYTGLSYVDLWLFKIESDYMDYNGIRIDIYFITGNRGKNGNPYSVEFNSFAREIYDKYNGEFPHITNQGYNKLLKKIAFTLNISKDLSTHNARKTYTTMRYKQGMSFEGLADEVGNTPDVLKKHYITNSRERIKRDIQNLTETFLIAST